MGGFNGGPDAIERLAATLTEAARDVRDALTGQTADAQQFDPMAELAKWRRWATGILGCDGFRGDQQQRAALAAAADRAVTIADEAFGLGPVEPLDATLTRIERGISEQHIRNAALERIAKAATAFVDEQGKHGYAINGDHDTAEIFAGGQFADLVDAVKAAGR